MIWLGKSCTAPPTTAPDDAVAEKDAPPNTLEPMTALDHVVEEVPQSSAPDVQVEATTAHVEDMQSSVTPAPVLEHVITARLKYFSPSSNTGVTIERPTDVHEPKILTTHAPSSNAEKSFAQVLHSFTALRGGAIRFDFGSCKDIFED